MLFSALWVVLVASLIQLFDGLLRCITHVSIRLVIFPQTKLQAASVKGHMLSHSNEWPHACHVCSRKFLHHDWLEKHLSAVHTCGAHVHSAQRPALCDTCGKTFSNRYVCKTLSCYSSTNSLTSTT